MHAAGLDRASDRLYDRFAEEFGHEDPRSSGYRSVRSYNFEAAVVRKLLRRYEGCILDVGCGAGLITGPLVREGRSVFGLDYNERAAFSASRRNLLTVRGDAFSMPFKKASFDVVLSTGFIQQYGPDHTKKLLEEIARVTRPGGVLILVWRQGTSLMRRLITNSLRVADWARGKPILKLFDHSLENLCGWSVNHQLETLTTLSVSPLLGLTLRNARGWASLVFGTSYIAVFRKRL